MNRPNKPHRFAFSLLTAAVVVPLLVLLYRFAPALEDLLRAGTGLDAGEAAGIDRAMQFALWLILSFVVVRAANELIFGVAFRKRRGYEAPDLVRNIFSLVAYALVFSVLFQHFFQISLGAVFTTSAVFGVIIGLALQSTLGNFFAGISFQADKPFQVGDVITADKWTGVVESVTWRGVKLRTFQNHIVLVSNTTIANYAIEVCPRGNLNARVVFFGALYGDSPVKVIHVVREAVREAENVSPEMTPVVRIRNFGDSAVEYECKYWLINYATYNDTDALVRQRIWYAFHRAGLSFAYPTRTVHISRAPLAAKNRTPGGDRLERLSGVDLFAPLT
ncbi:MAG TPA: mechanosensitive ion channel domain-containing protein, partial [Pyrinomonadaceae bacterium]|nr:mechanosensitive ion channel domain-containing protein [Pyrinomonadaceae bacterium]